MVDLLIDSDAAIGLQVMRDPDDAPPAVIAAERVRGRSGGDTVAGRGHYAERMRRHGP